MRAFLGKRWFLLSLLALIAAGMTIGAKLEPGRVSQIADAIDPSITTMVVLFLMSFSLDNRQLRAAFRAPGPVLWATCVNLVLLPLIAWALMPLQRTPDFRIGLMIAGSVPATMAAASVWTRKAGGNDAISLLVTCITSGVCFAVTPFWLDLATKSRVELDAGSMAVKLITGVLIPTLAGQLVRLIPAFGRIATRHKVPIGVIAQVCILMLVFTAACEAGMRSVGGGAGLGVVAIAIVWGSAIVLHIVAMIVAVAGAKILGYSRADRIAIAFAGSQKTLPVGVLIATDAAMLGNPNLLGPGQGVPFAVFPMLMYHASQLFIDTIVADRFAASAAREPVETPEEKADLET